VRPLAKAIYRSRKALKSGAAGSLHKTGRRPHRRIVKPSTDYWGEAIKTEASKKIETFPFSIGAMVFWRKVNSPR